MAVEITRTTWTDDDGSGTTGSLINNAFLQALYDQIDDALADLYGGAMGITSQAAGDLIYAASPTALARLGIGAANTVLTSDGSVPQWSTSLTLAGTLGIGYSADASKAILIGSSANYKFAIYKSPNGYLPTYFDSQDDDANSSVLFRMRTAGTPVSVLGLFASGNVGILSGAKLRLDGVADTGDTYIYESSANVTRFVQGGTASLQIAAGEVQVLSAALVVQPTQKLYLDGGGDTYIYEAAANNLSLVVGGAPAFNMSPSYAFTGSTHDLGIYGGKYIYLDYGTNNHWIRNNGADGLELGAGGSVRLRLGAHAYLPPAYNNTTSSGANVVVASDGELLRSTSSTRYKENMLDITIKDARRVVMGLRPGTWVSKDKSKDGSRRWPGFFAEQVHEVEPLLCTTNPEGQPEWVMADRIPAYMIPVMQDHEARIAALEAQR